MKKVFSALLIYMVMSALLAGCGGSSSGSPYAGRETVSLDGYESMADYEGESRMVDTTVKEIDELMSSGESFVFFASYDDCPYCNRILPYLNDAVTDADTYCGFLDTRKDPDWMTNMDIDDYDLFVKRFGKYLDEDENGDKHLYTPDLYVIKDGKVVSEHQGVIEGADDPEQPLTSSQEEELRELLKNMLAELD